MAEPLTEIPNFPWFISFLAVIRCEGYKKAGKLLGIDQSTVSRHVIDLEKWIGHPLLTKNRPARLTEEGKHCLQIILNFAKSIYHIKHGHLNIEEKSKLPRDEKIIQFLLFPPFKSNGEEFFEQEEIFPEDYINYLL